MKFNIKLFVLVGVLAGFRDVCGMEDINNKDYGDFIVAELTDDVNDELKTAMDKMRVIKAVYKKSSVGFECIITRDFKDQLSSILVCDRKDWEKVSINNINTVSGPKIIYNMHPNKEYTVYFIFNEGGVESTKGMFRSCFYLISADFTYFNTEKVKDMSNMFSKCCSLTELNLSSFNTKNVTNMSNMFDNCTALRNLNISKFNTQNVTDMSGMFFACTALTKLDLSSFNTEKVTNMSCMFYGCTSLTKLDLNMFNTESVKDMSGMFFGCTSLKELYLSKFNTQNVTNMFSMFYNCTALDNICLSKQYSKIMKKDCCCGKGYVSFGKVEVTDLDTDRVKIVWQD